MKTPAVQQPIYATFFFCRFWCTECLSSSIYSVRCFVAWATFGGQTGCESQPAGNETVRRILYMFVRFFGAWATRFLHFFVNSFGAWVFFLPFFAASRNLQSIPLGLKRPTRHPARQPTSLPRVVACCPYYGRISVSSRARVPF